MKINEELPYNQNNQFTQSQISDEVNDKHNLKEIILEIIRGIIYGIIADTKVVNKVNSQNLAQKVNEKLSQELQLVVSKNNINLKDEVNNYLEARVFHSHGDVYSYNDEINDRRKFLNIDFSR